MLNVLNKYRCFAGLALILVAAALLPGCSGDNGNSLPFNSLSSNSLDGTGAAARFNGPYGITSDGTNLYVADRSNHTIRQVVISTGVVTTLAGTAGTLGTTDGTGATARFNLPSGITTDGTNLYVTDTGNHTLRKIVIASGVVTTIAGTAGISGIIDATIGTDARFNLPSGITTDGTNIYVADTGNHTLRKVAISSGAVTTIAGAAGQPGSVFQDMVAADALRFSRQYPEFKINPAEEMQKALVRLKSDEKFSKQYTRFVDELVYGTSVPFAVAQQDFIRLAEQLLSSL